jgi:hypothetical protein
MRDHAGGSTGSVIALAGLETGIGGSLEIGAPSQYSCEGEKAEYAPTPAMERHDHFPSGFDGAPSRGAVSHSKVMSST